MSRARTFCDAFADVAFVMNEDDFGTVMFDEFFAFDADGIGHNDDDFVAAHGADKGKSDALVAGCGFYNDGVFVNFAGSFGSVDHGQCRTCFDGTANV